MVKDQAEVIVILDHFKFKYFFELRLYLKQFRPELLYTLQDHNFSEKIKTFLFKKRVCPT